MEDAVDQFLALVFQLIVHVGSKVLKNQLRYTPDMQRKFSVQSIVMKSRPAAGER